MSRVFQALSGLALLVAATFGNVEPRTISANYFRDALTFSAPYEAAHSGEAELKLELLTPEDHVIGEVKRHKRVTEGSAVWNARMVLGEQMTLDELVWQRVRFTLRYENQTSPDLDEIRSLSEILERPVLRVLGERWYIAGAPAAMRVIVTGSDTGERAAVVKRGRVKIELLELDHEPRL